MTLPSLSLPKPSKSINMNCIKFQFQKPIFDIIRSLLQHKLHRIVVLSCILFGSRVSEYSLIQVHLNDCFLITGDVVVHLFLPPQRAFYNLEEFYGNATSVELPFENQPPFRNEGAYGLSDDAES